MAHLLQCLEPSIAELLTSPCSRLDSFAFLFGLSLNSNFVSLEGCHLTVCLFPAYQVLLVCVSVLFLPGRSSCPYTMQTLTSLFVFLVRGLTSLQRSFSISLVQASVFEVIFHKLVSCGTCRISFSTAFLT